MSEFKKVVPVRAPKIVDTDQSAETRYWSKFSDIYTSKQLSKVPCLSFSRATGNDLAVCSSTRVQILDSRTCTVKKTLARFRDTVNCADFRNDGALIVTGCDDGAVQVFDLGSRAVLRHFKTHSAPVYAVSFVGDGTKVLSCSDDMTALVHDIPTESVVGRFVGHSDAVRSGFHFPINPNLYATGSYDHTIRFWDTRVPSGSGEASPACVMSIDHGAPVSALAMHPSGRSLSFRCLPLAYIPMDYILFVICLSLIFPAHTHAHFSSLLTLLASSYHSLLNFYVVYLGNLIASAGETSIKIWDVLGGGALVSSLATHQKTVTSLCIDRTGTRLLSAGLDQQVKFCDLSTFTVVHSLHTSAPILSLALSPAGDAFALGLTDGTVSLRRRADSLRSAAQSSTSMQSLMSAERSGAAAGGMAPGRTLSAAGHFTRGMGYQGREDIVIAHEKKQKLQAYNDQLKRFEYAGALDASLRTGDRTVVMAVLEELTIRNGLRQAIGQREKTESLEPFLRFLVKNLTHPQCHALIDIAHEVLDMYAVILGQSRALDEAFLEIARKVDNEIRLQSDCLAMKGELDMLLQTSLDGMDGGE